MQVFASLLCCKDLISCVDYQHQFKLVLLLFQTKAGTGDGGIWFVEFYSKDCGTST